MSLGSWYVSRGRIDRRTYWLRYFLPVFVVLVVVAAVVFALFGEQTAPGTVSVTGGPAFLLFAVYLAVLTPALTSARSRLHDTGRSGWWLLIGFLPLVGAIVLLVFYCLPGDPGPNRYGPPAGALQQQPGWAPQQQYGQPPQGYGQQPPQGYGQQP